MKLEKSNNLQKRVTNLVNKLRVDENSILFGELNVINVKLEKTLKNRKYEKDKRFFELILRI